MRRGLRRWRRAAIHWLGGLILPPVVWLWRKSLRVRLINDPRPDLRRRGHPYIFALLHGQQVTALLAHDEPTPLALVSRSRDGGLLAQVLAAVGVATVRGSRRRGTANKGGGEALAALAAALAPTAPVIVAVDGPRGPAGEVRRGALALAARTGAAVLPVALWARGHTPLRKTWDQTELPWPFATVWVHFGEPIWPPATAAHDPAEGRSWVEALRPQLQATLCGLRYRRSAAQPPS